MARPGLGADGGGATRCSGTPCAVVFAGVPLFTGAAKPGTDNTAASAVAAANPMKFRMAELPLNAPQA